ncbi:hypothetical protein [Blastochloris viridis]|uniref:Uncharacterized protein n=1 Tax=Blastochloris viridis TaxID=1079 RepID=A0A0P0JFE4_BLAVI|nr:hypothetical protein [Blastochloris viridis]ALK08978.1 hypothetical protein BVIR_1189 [Blastochloris viridis]CUU41639.1 hypothetical protein BVIRIDIS_06320 [Blastochloris viridis]
MTTLITSREAIASVAKALGMRTDPAPTQLGDELIAQALRRAAFILAPCAAHELAHAVSGSLASLALEDPEFAGRVETILESLVTYGDILEMRADAENPWVTSTAYTLRSAPPSFVARKNGSIFLLGVAGDQISALTEDLGARIVHRGLLRVLLPLSGEELPLYLKELGLLPLSERTWLRLPRSEPASAYAGHIRSLVAAEPRAGSMDGLTILDTSRPVNFYRDRWVEPRNQHTGFYVARRPQKYGAAIWCVADLEAGRVNRFTDLSEPGDRIRPSDMAWRIQAAFDALAGHPQRYRSSPRGATTLVRFYAPIPSWAERRLTLAGTKTRAERCLFSYDIPNEEWPGERAFLNEALWMNPID